MKRTMKRSELLNKDEIWNGVVEVISNYDLSSNDQTAHEAFLVFQYYSELESGGHEMLFTWFSDYIEEVGITIYLNELISILEKIGADKCASIEKEYGEEIWKRFKELENGSMDEDTFYQLIELADGKYYNLNGELGELLETYFVNIYRELIEVID